MSDRFFPEKQTRNARVVRPVSGKVFVWLALIAVVGSLISCGYMVSARRHFESVAMGYEKESLRRQRAALEEQLRRLQLDLARASSTGELERRARQLGLGRPEIKQGRIRRPPSETADR